MGQLSHFRNRSALSWPLWRFGLFSLLFHVMLWQTWQWYRKQTRRQQPLSPPPHTLLSFPEATPLPATPTQPPDRSKPLPSGTVVEFTGPVPAKEAPPEARFLAEKNHRVEKEKKARQRSPALARVSPSQARMPARALPSKPRISRSKSSSRVSPAPLMKAPVQAEGLKSAASSSEKEEAVNKVEREGSSADKPITDSNALMLSPESLAKVNEEAVRESPDALIGVHEGDETLLNTREFKYAAFFNRVKAAVAMHWHPQEAGQRHESVYGLLGERTRVTVLEVVLDADGGLVGTRVQISSGLPFLDEEAQQAFVRSAPFLHPPAALLDPESRRIAFRFGFYIESTRLF